MNFLNQHLTGIVLRGLLASFLPISIPLAVCQKQDVKPYVSSVWVSDNGDGSYKNPILFADYSDPDVCRVGDDFYMTSSSFNCVPALPILHSKDLVNWEIINYAVRQFPDEFYNTVQHGNGVWAPSIRFHQGWFYIYWGDPDRGIFMVKTQDPAAQWSEPVLVKKAYGNIDPCPLWDDDGKMYMVHAFANSRAGLSDVLQVQELTPEGDGVLRNRQIVFNGYPDHFTVEGPKFYKRNGYYYIFAPAGGVATGWQLVLRARNPFGPYVEKIVLAQGNTAINGPHQGGYVELENGEAWFIHFQEKQPYGRIVHLQPVIWKNDWPVIGSDLDGDGTGEPVLSFTKPKVKAPQPIKTPVESDEFSAKSLGLQWQWQARPGEHWYALNEKTGHLRLQAKFNESATSLWMVPNLLLQKFPAPAFSATTKMDATQLIKGEKAGLVIMGLDYATISLTSTNQGYRLDFSICENAMESTPEEIRQSVNIAKADIWFCVDVHNGGICRFKYSENGIDFKEIGQPFQSKEGRWIGAKVGIYATSTQETGIKGSTDFDWFRIENLK